MPIITQGIQVNQMTGLNPKELDDFQLTLQWTFPDYLQTLSWLAPDLPSGLRIDNNGVISGKIKAFLEQPKTSSMKYPVEKLKENCENWQSSGQSMLDSFDFPFVVTHNFIYNQQTPSGPVPTPMTETANIIIKVVKNYSLDNKAIVEQYYSDGWKIGSYTSANDYINNGPCSAGTFPK